MRPGLETSDHKSCGAPVGVEVGGAQVTQSLQRGSWTRSPANPDRVIYRIVRQARIASAMYEVPVLLPRAASARVAS
jgi:hypothetical protein